MALESACIHPDIPAWGYERLLPCPARGRVGRRKRNSAARSAGARGGRAPRRRPPQAAAVRVRRPSRRLAVVAGIVAVARVGARRQRQRRHRPARPASNASATSSSPSRRRRPQGRRQGRGLQALQPADRGLDARDQGLQGLGLQDEPADLGQPQPGLVPGRHLQPGRHAASSACSSTRSSTAGSRSSTSRARRRTTVDQLEALRRARPTATTC